MQKLYVKIAGMTDQGRTRRNNEDAVWTDADMGLLIVADGMGGHQAGEVASSMAVSSITREMRQPSHDLPTSESHDTRFSDETNRLGFCVRLANQMIFEAASRQPDERGMGTTCTAALITGDQLSLAHVGDSRCYLVRDGEIEQLTKDHSLVMEQVRQGLLSKDDEAVRLNQNILTRSLGTQPDVKIDLDEYQLLPGDVLVLCSDGIDKELTEQELLNTVIETPEPEELAQRLIDQANEAGGRDNITVAIARIEKASFVERIKGIFKT